MNQVLLFLGDIKGTKNALENFSTGGREVLERRIEHMQNGFSETFCRFGRRSRSLVAVTLSDSVIAYWTDIVEGKRFALEFMFSLWNTLDPAVVRFRGFLDTSDCVAESSVVAELMARTNQSFVRVLPASVAAWSVTLAEASHFPDGLFLSTRLSELLPPDSPRNVFHAGPFEYFSTVIREAQPVVAGDAAR